MMRLVGWLAWSRESPESAEDHGANQKQRGRLHVTRRELKREHVLSVSPSGGSRTTEVGRLGPHGTTRWCFQRIYRPLFFV